MFRASHLRLILSGWDSQQFRCDSKRKTFGYGYFGFLYSDNSTFCLREGSLIKSHEFESCPTELGMIKICS
jgi:hypothetical protein